MLGRKLVQILPLFTFHFTVLRSPFNLAVVHNPCQCGRCGYVGFIVGPFMVEVKVP